MTLLKFTINDERIKKYGKGLLDPNEWDKWLNPPEIRGDFIWHCCDKKIYFNSKRHTMKLIEFKQEKGSVYINVDKIVSITEKPDDKTEITTVNYNEFYNIDENIKNVLKRLDIYGDFTIYKLNQ